MVPADQLPAEFALRPRGEEALQTLLRGEAIPDEVNEEKEERNVVRMIPTYGTCLQEKRL